ncbi:MAG: TonB-dependent receptor [Paludibacter sp.]|nr:TonB-dependent receptor [Paludibacter sp.]
MKRLIIFIICIQCVALIFAQQFQLKGKVRSTDGEELIGVSVSVDGTSKRTVTDIDGNYKLAVNVGDKLKFSYIGFKKENLTVNNQNILNVRLVPDQAGLDEVVVVGYGKAKRITMTGAVSAINAREIRNIPTSSVQNALTGKLPGFFSQQSSGQPGKDASDFFIRGVSSLNPNGNKPLIIVDDVEYTYDQLQQININEIESISILKDASTTAIYGIKGANGVLVVKTRRGAEGKPQITTRYEVGIQMPVRTPKFLNSYQTAQLVNEAYKNDGLNPIFSDQDLSLFQNGQDPYGHPDVNWYNEVFKKSAYQQNANIDISGGSKSLRYFITGGIFTQNGLVKDFSDSFNQVNTNYFYKRFNYRTNLDFDVTKTLNLRLDMTTRFMNINEPRSVNAVSEIYDFSKMHPYSAPVMNPNGTYAYTYDTEGKKPTLNARLANEGYKRTRRFDSNILFSANQKLDFITNGLSTSLRVAYSSIDENYRQAVRGSYPTYHYDSRTKTYSIHPDKNYAYGTYLINGDQVQSIKDLNLQAYLNYETKIKDDHNLKIMLLYNRQSRTVDKNDYDFAAAQVPANFEGYTGTFGYNFKNKYLADFNMAYNGTDRFGKNNRYGFFPAVAFGYNISQEKFFSENVPNIQLLKLRASYGLVGSDVAFGNRYLYKQVYLKGSGYNFGEANETTYDSYYEGSLGNENVTWEKAKKFDVGIDMNLFDKLSLTVDYFYDYRYDQLVVKQNIPLMFGIGVSPENIAKTSNQGFDGQISYQTKIGNVDFNTNFVFSYAKNKIIYEAEAEQRYPWLAETGGPIGQPFGYTFIGYYSQADIDKIKSGNKTDDGKIAVAVPNTDVPVQAGDLKYKDLNSDGIINDYDKGRIGKPNLPTTTLGWTIGARYKGFSASLLFQSSFDYSFSVVGTGIEAFKSQFQPIHQSRWTQERVDNGESIAFPRLTTNPSTVNSAAAYMSDFWLINALYVRLKTVDLSYQIPDKVLPSNIGSARVYLNAYNLFTFTNYNKYQQDPEIKTNSAGDAYMNQRVINVGVQMTF